MGNNNPRYYNTKEAYDIIGLNTSDRLSRQLNQYCGKYMDYAMFTRMISLQFDRMPKALCECLYHGFAYDIHGKIEVKDFISALAAVNGQDQSVFAKFLFRVYSAPGQTELERNRIEKILMFAYSSNLDKKAAHEELENLFHAGLSRHYINQNDFESYQGPINLMAGWVQAVLTVFIEQPPPRLAALERRYSAALESEQMMARYGAPKDTCDQLRQVFYARCPPGSSMKAELSEEVWMEWTSEFLPPTLARIIFESKLDKPLKTVWRFVDFAEFCVIYGMSNSLESMASALCVAFQHNRMNVQKTTSKLVISTDDSDDDGISTANMKLLLYLLSLPSARCDNSSVDAQCLGASLESLQQYVNPVVERDLCAIEDVSKETANGPSLQPYVHTICNNYAVLPGLKLLAMTACCLFGLRPTVPSLEIEYITELMMWNQERMESNSRLPFGPVGSEWCAIASSWWLQWSYFVGKKDGNEEPPGMIDNWSILKKSSSAKQLQPGSIVGKDFEMVSHEVFAALQAWYGGGPKIVRKVIAPTVSTHSVDTRPNIELFPPVLKIYMCDDTGRTKDSFSMEIMVSRTSTVAGVIDEICRTRHAPDPSKLRLWSIESKNWKKQYSLSPDLTLEKAGIGDGHMMLLETALADGTWPKSQLQSQLEMEENKKSGGHGLHDSDSSTSLATMASASDTGGGGGAIVLNNGRIGLDNLGNTCYMNASLQALLHTQFLAEYFLTKRHLREINVTNKFGYEGRVALSFAKLVNDLWLSKQSDIGGALSAVAGAMGVGGSNAAAGTGPNSVSPKRFKREMGALRDQFAGDEQHDAQEFLSFLLDGLSEDLNLVHEKPYTEQPDSDGRPDKVLADIWWENHLKRDFSVIQSIFTGQFKSITRCTKCEYNSARFEPFNMLSVPLPEEEKRSIVVHVVPKSLEKAGGVIRCSVRVTKTGTLRDVANEVKGYSVEGVGEDPLFMAVELSGSKVVNVHSMLRKLDMIRESDSLFFFEISELPRYRQLSVTSKASPARKPTPYPPAKRMAQSPSDGSSSREKRGRVGGAADEVEVDEGEESDAMEKDMGAEDPVDEGVDGGDVYDGDSDSADVIGEEEGADDGDYEAEVTGGRNLARELAPKDDVKVDVVFVHRRVRFCGSSGLQVFKMEPTGVPLIEVLPGTIRAVDLYAKIAERVHHLLKTPISELVKSIALSPPTPSALYAKKPSFQQEKGQSGDSDGLSPDEVNIDLNASAGGAAASRIRPVATEDAIGGDVPPGGFVLRHVLPEGDFCGRCHWLSRCEGCIIPYDDPDLEIDLDGGITIAIDWHFVVFQEVLDMQPLSVMIDHSSMDKHFQYQLKELPLDKCLQKFTEEEPLDDTICPKCHEDGCLMKKFAIWRLPAVLIIQLKRFQFNSYSRRKLNNQVDFPLDGLDMTPYMAPSAVSQYLSIDSCIDDNATRTFGADVNEESEDEEGGKDIVIPEEREEIEDLLKRSGSASSSTESPPGDSCNVAPEVSYDLYSSVHHVGALGGGHYIAAVRDDGGETQRAVTTTSPLAEPSPLTPHSPTPASSKWWSYNDSTVMPITSASDVVSPSAYVLFYVRRDVRHSHVSDVHKAQVQPIVENEGSVSDVQALSIDAHSLEIRDGKEEAVSPASNYSDDSNIHSSENSEAANRQGEQCILS